MYDTKLLITDLKTKKPTQKAKNQTSVESAVQVGKEKKGDASLALKRTRTSFLEHDQDVTLQSNDAKPNLPPASRLKPQLHENQNPKLITTVSKF